MYSRSYYDEAGGAVNLPENYVGTAFSDTLPPEPRGEEYKSESESAQCVAANAGGNEPSILTGLFGGIKSPLLGNLRLPEIGLEEILIIATAAFLFFSKDGDRECAIMLLLLLLVN